MDESEAPAAIHPATPPRTLEEDIAYAMELPRELLQVMPDLFADLPGLSGATSDVLQCLRKARLPQGASVLDLGCGRGELALAMAEAFDARVHGIDGTAAFLAMARQSAKARGLAGRCQFVEGDLREAVRTPAAHDAVLLIALGPVLGDAAETMAALRNLVRPGGLILIDDGYLTGPPPDEPGWEAYAPLKETERCLTRHGDHIEARLDRRESMADFDRVADPAVLRNAAAITKRRPDLAESLQAYLTQAFGEAALWNTDLMPALWCLRKA